MANYIAMDYGGRIQGGGTAEDAAHNFIIAFGHDSVFVFTHAELANAERRNNIVVEKIIRMMNYSKEELESARIRKMKW